ncbi:protein SCO1 [Gammaproteobacteria bacterium]
MSSVQSEGSGFTRYAIFVIIAAAAILFSWFGLDYFEQDLKPHEVTENLKIGTFLPQTKPLSPFTLTDQDGKPFTLDNLHGHWTFLAIGYTACPDICPTIMSTFKAIDLRITSSETKPIAEFLFVSVDPNRDSPKKVGDYVRYFNPRFLGATGSNDDVLHALTGQLGLFYKRVEGGKTSMSYLIDHSASIMLINPEGSLSAIFSSPQDPKLIAEDFATINGRYQSSIIKG